MEGEKARASAGHGERLAEGRAAKEHWRGVSRPSDGVGGDRERDRQKEELPRSTDEVHQGQPMAWEATGRDRQKGHPGRPMAWEGMGRDRQKGELTRSTGEVHPGQQVAWEAMGMNEVHPGQPADRR